MLLLGWSLCGRLHRAMSILCQRAVYGRALRKLLQHSMAWLARATRQTCCHPPAPVHLPTLSSMKSILSWSGVAADKNCPIHRKPCVSRKEENYFFALSKYQQQLEASGPGPDAAAAAAAAWAICQTMGNYHIWEGGVDLAAACLRRQAPTRIPPVSSVWKGGWLHFATSCWRVH